MLTSYALKLRCPPHVFSMQNTGEVCVLTGGAPPQSDLCYPFDSGFMANHFNSNLQKLTSTNEPVRVGQKMTRVNEDGATFTAQSHQAELCEGLVPAPSAVFGQ